MAQKANFTLRNMRGTLHFGQQRYLGSRLDLGTLWAGQKPSSRDDQSGQGPKKIEFCPLGSLGLKDMAL